MATSLQDETIHHLLEEIEIPTALNDPMASVLEVAVNRDQGGR